uniref:Chitin-binding type-2 domain-containing protein n=1 Tax=Setaria digitata TaxID=48799 RepID=A0A915PIP9_9BILA
MRRGLTDSIECTQISEEKDKSSLLDFPQSTNRQQYLSKRNLSVLAYSDKKLVESSLDNSSYATIPSVIWRSVIGDICQLPSNPRPTANPNEYVECVFQPENAGNRTDLGTWMLKKCPVGYKFVAPARDCKAIRFINDQQQLCDGPDNEKYDFCSRNKTSPMVGVLIKLEIEHDRDSPDTDAILTLQMRRARQVACQQGCVNSRNQIPKSCRLLSSGQLYCPTQGEVGKQQRPDITAPQPCPIVVRKGAEDIKYQGICSWMIDPLVIDPESSSHFLQCQPAPNNLYCGRWQRMPCEPGLIFSALFQVCVWNPSLQPEKVLTAYSSSTITPTYPSITQLSQASTGNLISSILVDSKFVANTQCSCDVGVQIGSCGPSGQCPGHSACKSNQLAEQASVSNCRVWYAAITIKEREELRRRNHFISSTLPVMMYKFNLGS